MIQKLEYNVIDKNGIGYEPSIEDIITKLNEVIDALNQMLEKEEKK